MVDRWSKSMIIFEANDMTVPPHESGMHTFMYRGQGCETLRAAVQRPFAVGKVHHMPLRPDEKIEDYLWGQYYLPPGQWSCLYETVIIQNIFAARGLAPRIYGVGAWQDKYGQLRPVQITDDLGKCDWGQDRAEVYAMYDHITALGRQMGMAVPGRDSGVQNVVAGKWVDFGGFSLLPEYEAQLTERFWQGTRWGDRPYQQILGANNAVDTCRDMEARIADLGLDTLDFTPRYVLDIGCSGGQFLNYLTRRYRARGTGYDTARAIPAAAEYSAYIGAWNIDYHVAALEKPVTEMGSHDLVLFLSMSRHVGLPEYVKDAVQKRLIVELHSEHEAEAFGWLADDFDIIREHRSIDYNRLVLHAERKHA